MAQTSASFVNAATPSADPITSTYRFPDQIETRPITPVENLANHYDNEETVNQFRLLASSYVNSYFIVREKYRRNWMVYDAMSKCMTNRAIASIENLRGVNTTDKQRAQTGSTYFHRLLQQHSAILSSILLSKRVPGQYNTISNAGVDGSDQDDKPAADQMNSLLEYTSKIDDWATKFIEFSYQIHKNGNVPVLFYMNRKAEYVRRMRPKIEVEEVQQADPMTGMPVTVQAGAKVVGEEPYWEEMITENWPSWKTLDIMMVMADELRGDLCNQDCVVLVSIRSKDEIYNDIRDGVFGEKAGDMLNEKFSTWTKSDRLSQSMRDRLLNMGLTMSVNDLSKYWLQWDVFMRAPIDQGKWDANNPPALYWGTLIGNDITNAACVRLVRNPDPDGEIPLKMIHAMPDDPDLLYHKALGDVVRSDYAVECTVKNQFIDCVSNKLEAPFIAVEGQVRKTQDFTFKRNGVWWVQNKDALEWLGNKISDTTQTALPFLQFIKDDMQSAAGMSENMAGASYGARTSALEANNIQQQTSMPHMIQSRYILSQLLPWLLRKHASYWQAYGIPQQVYSISDSPKQYQLDPMQMKGPFDIKIDIMDDFEDTIVQGNRQLSFLQTVASIPQAAQAVDIVEGLKSVARKLGIKDIAWIRRMPTDDAVDVANTENMLMQQGQMAHPTQGENHNVHLQIHQGELAKWAGLGGTAEGQWVEMFLKPHIAETEQMAAGGGGGMMAGGAAQGAMAGAGTASGTELTPGAPPPATSGNASAGEELGNEIAAAFGAQTPQVGA
jgi:Asp-tRNA(Asn)/Glu-tRNA(Gln) amidotransferase C subunit